MNRLLILTLLAFFAGLHLGKREVEPYVPKPEPEDDIHDWSEAE